jgi:hypothetical protein
VSPAHAGLRHKILDVHNCIYTENPPPIHDFDSEEELNEYLEKTELNYVNGSRVIKNVS